MSFPGNTQVEVVDSKRKVKEVHISDVKYVLPADSHIKITFIISPSVDCQN